MAKRCEHCRYWEDTVFAFETASGWGVWYGVCHLDGHSGQSLYFACDRFKGKGHKPRIENGYGALPGQLALFPSEVGERG